MTATYKIEFGYGASFEITEIIKEGRADTEPSFVAPAQPYEYSQIFNVPIKLDWPVLSSETDYQYLLNLFVGESLLYKRREIMLNLARYTRWPYTN